MFAINLWAVAVAGVTAWVVGAIWYSKLLFGNQWMKLAQLKDVRPNPVTYLVGLLAYVLAAYILAQVAAAFGANSLVAGMMAGFWTWLGFVATISLGSVLYEGKPLSLYLLNNGYNLISFLVMGGIIGLWR